MAPPRFPAPGPLLLVIALPIATLVAGGWTLALVGGDGLDTVADPVRRTAQVQQVDTGADEHAARLGLAADLAWTPEAITVDVRGLGPERSALVLRLEHPLDAGRDVETRLVADRSGPWTGAPFDARTAWRVSLAPVTGDWRLVGRWPRDGQRLHLEPALPPPVEAGDGPR